jgi:hypothetical protein
MKGKSIYKVMAALIILLIIAQAVSAACYGKTICNRYQYPSRYCRNGAMMWCYVTSCYCTSPRYQSYYTSTCYCKY